MAVLVLLQILPLSIAFSVSIIGYVIYQRFFHPLSKFPGPFLASLTDLWKIYNLASHRAPEMMQDLHDRYGQIVRIGPNDLSFTSKDAVAAIYKSGRSMPKSVFYDGFTAFKPNLFGTQDEDLHALRRRQMAHGFSAGSLAGMEGIYDRHIEKFRSMIDKAAATGEAIDLKERIAYYAYDVIGELAFSTQFDTQETNKPENLPPINDHIFLSCLYGSVPGLLPHSRNIANKLPLPWLQGLLKSRTSIRDTTARCVAACMKQRGKHTTHNLLTQLVEAKDPETGLMLDTPDIASEAFAYVVAGSHTTSGTLTFLMYHLLQNPDIFKRVQDELDQGVSPLPAGAVPYAGLENKLPYFVACMRENMRLTPVFTMPLPRVVTAPGGTEIAGHVIPQGTVASVVNWCLQRNPRIWGEDSNTFNPERFVKGGVDPNLLMPFGQGHRACIGRNVATVSMWKFMTTLLRNYTIEPVDPHEKLDVLSVGLSEKKGPLMVRISKRS